MGIGRGPSKKPEGLSLLCQTGKEVLSSVTVDIELLSSLFSSVVSISNKFFFIFFLTTWFSSLKKKTNLFLWMVQNGESAWYRVRLDYNNFLSKNKKGKRKRHTHTQQIHYGKRCVKNIYIFTTSNVPLFSGVTHIVLKVFYWCWACDKTHRAASVCVCGGLLSLWSYPFPFPSLIHFPVG